MWAEIFFFVVVLPPWFAFAYITVWAVDLSLAKLLGVELRTWASRRLVF